MEILKEDTFLWTTVDDDAFLLPNKAMPITPLLALPDYSLVFVIEIDVSNTSEGIVLMKRGSPITYYSKCVASRH